VTLDPGLAVAHARIAQYYQRAGQRALADQHFRKAVELDPNDPLVLGFSASRAVLRDDVPAAVETWRRVAAQDPLSFIHRNNYGQMLMATGRPQEAIVEFRAAIELNPDEPDNRVELARAHILAGETQDAVDLLRDVPPSQQRDLAFALLVNDARYGPEARKVLKDLQVPPTEIRLSIRLAEALANAGDREAAIRVLQAARVESERRPSDAPMLRSYLREDIFTAPFLAPLRADPRWPALVAPPPPAPPPS
jgi:Tfp pilus assembly protein PilF